MRAALTRDGVVANVILIDEGYEPPEGFELTTLDEDAGIGPGFILVAGQWSAPPSAPPSPPTTGELAGRLERAELLIDALLLGGLEDSGGDLDDVLLDDLPDDGGGLDDLDGLGLHGLGPGGLGLADLPDDGDTLESLGTPGTTNGA